MTVSPLESLPGFSAVYLRETFGPGLAFVYGWAAFIAIETGGIAALAAAFSIYLGQFLSLSPAGEKLAGACMVLVLTVVNIHGIKFGKYIQNSFAVCKFGGLGRWCCCFSRTSTTRNSGKTSGRRLHPTR